MNFDKVLRKYGMGSRHAVNAMLTASSIVTTFPAFAQSIESDSIHSAQVEDIVVTARKRAENQQDIPVTVTTITGSDIAARNLSTVADLGNFTPNVSFTGGGVEIGAPVNASFFIRGIGQSDYAPTTEPGVGLYIDGVYFARAAGAVLELANLEQIEILKGPQGTLFGKNTMGGAINVTTLRPNFSAIAGSASVAYGEDNRLNLDGSLNIPLSDNLAFRIDAAYRSQDGYVVRPEAGDKTGEEGTTVVSGKLLWESGNGLSVLLSGDYTHIDAAAPVGFYPVYNADSSALVAAYNALVGGPRGTLITSALQSTDPYVDNGTGRNHSLYNGGGASLRIETEQGDTTLRSITAYRTFKTRNQRDADGSPATFNQDDYRDRQWQVSQEINLIGMAFDDHLQYTLGAYYFRERARSAYNANIAEGIYTALESLPAAVIPLGNFACPGGPVCAGGAGNPFNISFDLNATDFLDVRSESVASFAEFEWTFSDVLSVFGGVRYTYDDKSYDVSFERLTTGTFIVLPTTVSRSWSEISPRLGVRLRPTTEITLYATASKGYKAGGFNPRPGDAVAARTAYDPETVLAYEAGVKTDLFQRRVRFNTAVFYYDYRDLQLYVSTLAPGSLLPTQIIDNVGKARLWGIESDLTLAFNKALTLNASVGYLNSKYVEAATALTGLTTATPLKKAPKWSATAGAQYVFQLGTGELVTRIDYAYTSSSYAEVYAIEALKQRAHSLVNGRIAWTNGSGSLTIAAYGKNLFNTKYIVNGFDARSFNGSLIGVPSEPRELGGQVIFRF